MMAAKDFGMKKVAIAGGVASSGTRGRYGKACEEMVTAARPSPIFCTDNAAKDRSCSHIMSIKRNPP